LTSRASKQRWTWLRVDHRAAPSRSPPSNAPARALARARRRRTGMRVPTGQLRRRRSPRSPTARHIQKGRGSGSQPRISPADLVGTSIDEIMALVLAEHAPPGDPEPCGVSSHGRRQARRDPASLEKDGGRNPGPGAHRPSSGTCRSPISPLRRAVDNTTPMCQPCPAQAPSWNVGSIRAAPPRLCDLRRFSPMRNELTLMSGRASVYRRVRFKSKGMDTGTWARDHAVNLGQLSVRLPRRSALRGYVPIGGLRADTCLLIRARQAIAVRTLGRRLGLPGRSTALHLATPRSCVTQRRAGP
jgi:hypothetical protein